MGTITRNIFLFFPFLLTALTLALLITVMLSQHSTTELSDLYFLRVNTADANIKLNVAGQNLDVNVGGNSLVAAYYDVGLTNYCTGVSNTSAPNFCSKPKANFYFNPLEVWDVQNSPIANLVPDEWEKALNTYKQASKWMYAAYVVALVANIVTLLLGVASFFLSRVTSVLTWITADVAALFTVGASATATAIYSILAGVIRAKLHDEGITTTYGSKLLAITWIASAAAIAAGLLWSCGCCCGHSKHRDDKRSRSVMGRSNYERVPSPYKEGHHDGGYGQPVPMYGQPQHQWPGQQQHTAYEPYRQQV